MLDFKDTKMGDDKCPHCQGHLDMATSVEGQTPDPGDITVCIWCGTYLMYGDDMGLKLLTDEIYNSLPKETKTQLSVFRKAINSIKKTKT